MTRRTPRSTLFPDPTLFRSIHAGQVICVDGTPEMEKRVKAVLTNDPGMGILRHADAGYEDAIQNAKDWDVDIPMMEKG